MCTLIKSIRITCMKPNFKQTFKLDHWTTHPGSPSLVKKMLYFCRVVEESSYIDWKDCDGF